MKQQYEEKYIYEVINNVNHKRYIGQTVDPQRRFNEHKNCKQDKDETKVLYEAIKKYGIKNFSFNIIEGPIKNYNEREIYWIAEYNTYINNPNSWGYNMTKGGEEPPHWTCEEHPLAVHTYEEIYQIIDLLKNSELSFKEIADKFHYNRCSIERINKGQLWNLDTINYPIRESIYNIATKRADKIKYDLLYTNLTQKEIGLKYGVGRTTVTAINRGQNHRDETIDYPIRKQNQHSKPLLMIDVVSKEILYEFKDSVEAVKYLGYGAPSGIRACANGQTKTALGYIWKFKER